MGGIIKELIALYTMPQCERIVVAGLELCGDDESVDIHRTESALELLFDCHYGANSNPTNIIIPITKEAMERLSEINTELIRLRAPFITQYQRNRAVVYRREKLTQPLLCEAMVQQLPMGELLQRAALRAGARSAERLYAALDNLERAMAICGVRFDELNAEDIIVGSDGRLYPFRYDMIYFEVDDQDCVIAAEQPLEECQELRREIERLSEHPPKQRLYPTEAKPYSNTLSDIYGGYIYCREPREGLIAVEDLDGWGFVDEAHSVIIEPQYLSVSDFSVGIAVVQLTDSERYGVIDRQGNFLVEPLYALIEIDSESGSIRVESEEHSEVIDSDELSRRRALLQVSELDILQAAKK